MARRVIARVGGKGDTHAPVFSSHIKSSKLDYVMLRVIIEGTGSPVLEIYAQYYRKDDEDPIESKWRNVKTLTINGITDTSATLIEVPKAVIPDNGFVRYGISVSGIGDYEVFTELWGDETTFGINGDPNRVDDVFDLSNKKPISKYKVPTG